MLHSSHLSTIATPQDGMPSTDQSKSVSKNIADQTSDLPVSKPASINLSKERKANVNPLAILDIVLPIISKLPTIESGIMSLVTAVKGMIQGGANADDVSNAVEQSLPSIASAIVANTPHAQPPAPPAS